MNTTDSDAIAPKTKVNGTRSKHTFATGQAAVIKAAQEAQALNGGDPSYEGCLNSFGAAAIAFAQSACSFHYITQDGIDRHVGFLVINSLDNTCSVSTNIESAGLTLDITKESGGINVDYRNVSKTVIKPEALDVIESDGLTAEVTHYQSRSSSTLSKDDVLSCK